MPTIRDARGRLSVHDMTPPPPGEPAPITRRQGSPAPPDDRLPIRRDAASLAGSRARANAASAAVSRARGAQRAGFVKGASKTARRWNGGALAAESESQKSTDTPSKGIAQTEAARAVSVATRNAALTPRQEQVVDALRRLGTRKAVMGELGVKDVQTIDSTLLQINRKGLLPAALPDLPKRLQRAIEGGGPGPTAAKPAHIVSTESPSQGREAGVPATGAASVEPPERDPATPGSTPLGSPDNLTSTNDVPAPDSDPGIAAAYSAPDSTTPAEAGGGPVVGEPWPYLTVMIDCVALARAMQGWATYQMTAFFEGLAKVVAEVNR